MSKDKGIPLSQAGSGRSLNDLSANELRMRLELAGVTYSDQATKTELVDLVRKI